MQQFIYLFDCDGVILDTESQYSKFWAHIGTLYYPQMQSFAEDIKGMSLVDIFDRYFPDASQQKELKLLLDVFEESMEYAYIPGVEEFLKSLRDKRVRTALVTSSNHNKMAHVYGTLPEIRDYFDYIFTAEDIQRSKPAPDCFINAARRFGVEPQNCIVFEDSINGLTAAKESGAKVVGLTTTNTEQKIMSFCNLILPSFIGRTPDSINAHFAFLS
ncbi:HAD family phosphatase [uncultured Alloprevotella sp.]|uniref:HAD family hydrolase n=1 Tax=uncultured Alloprevotella sp. TaxID=1283315 RepID=UPI00325FCC81